ncbi:MAG: MarR family transcriptional regulator [Armatimonadetes bacterium]|nr:MarR family transcriptional regulator [Armatimonadota bacterium]
MKEELPQDTPSLATWWYLARAYHSLLHELTRFFEEHGVTGPQFGVLRCVDEAGPEGLPLSHLSERLMISCGHITGVVDRLEQNGFLRRERSRSDRRVVRARLTARGREIHRRLVPAYREKIAALLAALNLDEQRELARLCEQLHFALEADRRPQQEPIGPSERTQVHIHGGAV